MGVKIVEVPLPISSSSKKRWFFIKDITGIAAKWAIQQSPYIMPHNLEDAICDLTIALEEIWKKEESTAGMLEFNYYQMYELIKKMIYSISSITKWNEPRIKHNKQHVFVTRYSNIEPDDDFIDLDALCRNVTNDLFIDGAVWND